MAGGGWHIRVISAADKTAADCNLLIKYLILGGEKRREILYLQSVVDWLSAVLIWCTQHSKLFSINIYLTPDTGAESVVS